MKGLYFALGAIAGAAAGYLVAKKKFDKQLKEELCEARAYYKSKKEPDENSEEEEDDGSDAPFDPDEQQICMNQYAKLVNTSGYSSAKEVFNELRAKSGEENKAEKAAPSSPIIINGKAFLNENEDYDKITLFYCQMDDILVDDSNEPCRELQSRLFDCLSHFGELGEEDVVYVRDDVYGCDYEVIRENRSYWSNHINV